MGTLWERRTSKGIRFVNIRIRLSYHFRLGGMRKMRFEARWDNNSNCCCSSDTIEDVLGCILSMTTGKGKVFIYEFGKDGKIGKLVKIFTITN